MDPRSDSYGQACNRLANGIPSFEPGNHSSLSTTNQTQSSSSSHTAASQRIQGTDNSDGTKNDNKELDHERGQKRRMESLKVLPDKKARDFSYEESRSNKASSRQQMSPPSLPKSICDNYIVPVSRGTEKITMAIWNYFISHQMSEEDLRKKLLLRKSLLSVLTGAFPYCRLFMVGSSMTGFATKTSDVDMCLVITKDEVDQKRDAALILSSIARALKPCSFVRHSQVIRAKVPILKFYDQVSGVECDLNVNNVVGIRNTHLLRHYAYMDWRVRPLILFIKKWARFHDINDASKKTISSYSLSLMLIHYLQAAITPPVLPCLQEMKPEVYSQSVDIRKLSLSLEDKANFTSQNQATLGELFLGFLNYYSYVFRYNIEVISVRKGKSVPKFEAMHLAGDQNQWKFLNIEEPFDGSNTARSVYDSYVFTRIVRVFRASYSILEKSCNTEDILSRPF